MNTLRLLSALPCLLLAACQVTTFAQVPVAADPGCDPALVGDWRDHEPEIPGETPPEVVLRIDAACRVQVDEHKNGSVRRGDAVQLHLGRHGPRRYAWVDANWMMSRFDEEHRFPDGDVVLMRFAVEDDGLVVWNTDDKAIAHAVIDDDLTGEVLALDHDLFVRLTGEPDPDVLDRDRFFDDDAAHFRRFREE